MEIIIFLVGLLVGISVTTLFFKTFQKSSKSMTDELVNQMKLQFENTANKIFQESSEEFSNVNKEQLEDFFSTFMCSGSSLSHTKLVNSIADCPLSINE